MSMEQKNDNMTLPEEYKKQFTLVRELENIWVCEDKFTRMMRPILDEPVHGVDLQLYHIYAYLSKINRTYLYVIEDPNGVPFHDEPTFEKWCYYLDMLKMSIKAYDYNIVELAKRRLKDDKKNNPDTEGKTK